MVTSKSTGRGDLHPSHTVTIDEKGSLYKYRLINYEAVIMCVILEIRYLFSAKTNIVKKVVTIKNFKTLVTRLLLQVSNRLERSSSVIIV